MSYSCNHTRSEDYAVGYAVADNPFGPFTKYGKNPILKKNDSVHGVGHHSFLRLEDGKTLLCAYHCHNSNPKNFKPGMVCITTAEFKNCDGEDVLVINEIK